MVSLPSNESASINFAHEAMGTETVSRHGQLYIAKFPVFHAGMQILLDGSARGKTRADFDKGSPVDGMAIFPNTPRIFINVIEFSSQSFSSIIQRQRFPCQTLSR